MSAFDITVPTTRLDLADEPGGDVSFSDLSFTVANSTDHTVEAQGSVVPLDGAAETWFTILGSPTRSFAVDGVQRFTVKTNVPAGTEAKTYMFRFDVASVTQPQQEFSQGPNVAFDVPYVEPVAPPVVVQPRGYIATLVGAATGSLVLCLLFGMLAFFLARPDIPGSASIGEALGAGIGFVLVIAVAAMLGLWLGGIVGSFVGLRIKHYYGDFFTALVIALLLPIVGVVTMILVAVLPDTGGFVSWLLAVIAYAITIVASSFGARAVIVFFKTKHI